LILDNYIEIVVNSMDVKRLIEMNITTKVGDILHVPINYLLKGSGRRINVKCDVCGKIKIVSYGKYNKNIKNCDFYACSSKCAHEKVEKTSIKNFGYLNASNCPEKKNKRLKTMVERLGVENAFQNENIKNKSKQTLMDKYGVENIFQSEYFKDNLIKSNLKKYGVENVSQVPSIHIKQQKSGFRLKYHKETGLSYRGTYEKDFLDFCVTNNIIIEQGKRFKYFYDGRYHYYFSDFYFPKENLIVEIKSLWTYNRYLDVNEIKRYTVLELGYNFMFIIDMDYNEFLNRI